MSWKARALALEKTIEQALDEETGWDVNVPAEAADAVRAIQGLLRYGLAHAPAGDDRPTR